VPITSMEYSFPSQFVKYSNAGFELFRNDYKFNSVRSLHLENLERVTILSIKPALLHQKMALYLV